MAVDLDARRDKAERALATARTTAANAILSGKTPNTQAVLTAAATLEAVDVAETERTHENRAKLTANYVASQAVIRAELAAAASARQTAVADAEKACRALSFALSDEREASRTMSVALAGLGVVAPMSLMKSERERRMSEMIAAVLLSGGGIETSRRFGCISFTQRREFSLANGWAASEAAAVNAQIQSHTQEPKK